MHHQLGPLLHACVCANGDVLSAVDTLRAELQHLVAHSSDELFAGAARRWNDPKDASVSTFRFLVLVVACEWESQLMQFLLQHHVSDAADDMTALVQVCAQISQSSAATVLLLPVLDALLATAAAFTLAYSRGPQFEDDPGGFLHSLHPNPIHWCPSCSSSRFPLADSVMSDHTEISNTSDQDRWTRFLELSRGLDARRFDSKSGRTVYSAAVKVIEQQQHLLALVRLDRDTSKVDGDVLRVAIEKMQGMATQVLRVTSHYEGANACGRCADLSSADSPATLQASADVKDAGELDLIPDDAALESYLMGIAQCGNTEVTIEATAVNTTVEGISAYNMSDTGFQKLLKALTTQSSLSAHTVSDLVQKTQEELSAVADLDALGIQVSFLLSAQIRSTRRVAELNNEVNKSLTRQVLREFNSLTDGAEDCDRSVRMLMIPSGFCPSLILREIVNRAMTAPQQVQIYVQVLQFCPLLAEWTDEGATSSMLICELQSALRDLVGAEESFEALKPHLLALLCTLSDIEESNSATRRLDSAAVVSVQTLVREVLLPVLSGLASQLDGEGTAVVATEATTTERSSLLQMSNFFAFLHDFVRRAARDTHWRSLDARSQTTKALLAPLLRVYQDQCGPLTVEKAELQNTLLLTMKDLLGITSSLKQAVVSEIIKTSVNGERENLDAPVLMLIAQFSRDAHDWEKLATLRHLLQDLGGLIVIDKSGLNLETASRAIRLLLWKLFWSANTTSNTSQSQGPPFLSDERAWELLELLASDFCVVSSPIAISGRALVQKELARLILTCCASLFTCLNDGVLPRLVQMLEQPATSISVKLPKQMAAQLDTEGTLTAQPVALSCELPVSHLVMKLVSRLWSLLLISSEHSKCELVLQMGRHFLVSCARAVADSKSSLTGLLNCFEWVCFMLCLLSTQDDRMKELEIYESITRQLNVTLLQLLHLLSHIQVPNEADASFSQRFVASWMTQLPQDSFEQVRNFVSSAARNSV